MGYIKKIVFVSFLLSSILVFGQARVNAVQNGANTELYFNKAITAPTYDEVIGSPYLYEDFVPARVNEITKTHFVRFNVFDNSIEYKGEDGVIYSVPITNEYVIELLDGSGKVYEKHFYLDEKKATGNTFFERLYEGGNFGLYHKEMIDFTPLKLAKTSFEPDRPARFKKTKGLCYYRNLSADSKVLLKLPKKEKQFLRHFDAHSPALKKFIKEGNLNITDANHLIRILEFYFAQ